MGWEGHIEQGTWVFIGSMICLLPVDIAPYLWGLEPLLRLINSIALVPELNVHLDCRAQNLKLASSELISDSVETPNATSVF